MRSLNRYSLCATLAGALLAGVLSFAAPSVAQAQDQSASTETASPADPLAQPRGFISEPSTPVNVGNPVAATGPEQRVALVIGNSNYKNVAQLPNPANDARSVSQVLNSAGFEVIQAIDLGHDEMIDVLRNFSAKIAEKGPNAVAFVYYAGHGVQIAGDNYLIPVDANINSEADVPSNGIRLVDVMATLQAVPSRSRFVVVDACANNPFKNLGEATRGLAVVDAPNGSLVGYSTAPGMVAYDGQGNGSPYANAFVEGARQKNVPIEQFFKGVRTKVNTVTGGRQTPWETSALTSDFYFFGDTLMASRQQPVREVYSSASMRGRAPQDAFRYALANDSAQGYRDFIAFYPEDPYCERVRALLAAKLIALAWHEAVLANSPVAYQTFYNQYPTSQYAPLALTLKVQPKILPLYQPTNNFAPKQFGPQFGNSLHQIMPLQNLQQGGPQQGNNLPQLNPINKLPLNGVQVGNQLPTGNQLPINKLPLNGVQTGNNQLPTGNQLPINKVTPGIDLAKQGGIKIDPVLGGKNPGNVTVIDKLHPGLGLPQANGGNTTIDTKLHPTNTGIVPPNLNNQVHNNVIVNPTGGVKPILQGNGNRITTGNVNGNGGRVINTIPLQNNRPILNANPNLLTPKNNNNGNSGQSFGHGPVMQGPVIRNSFGGGGGGGMMARSFHM